MDEEYKTLMENRTWDLVPSTKSVNLIGTRWIYNVKRNDDGTINRFKARLVAYGFKQNEGVDFNLIYGPIVKESAIRIVPSLVISHEFCLKQVDVKNAFLQSNIELVYIAQPHA